MWGCDTGSFLSSVCVLGFKTQELSFNKKINAIHFTFPAEFKSKNNHSSGKTKYLALFV